MFSTSLRKERRRSTVSRSVFPTPTSRTSRAGATRAARDRRCRGNTWFIPYETIQRRDARATASRDVSRPVGDELHLLHGLTRARANARSVSRNWKFRGCGETLLPNELHRLRNRRRISARGPAQAPSGHTPRVLYPGEFSENFASGLTRLPGRGRTRSKIRAASGFAIG